MPPKATPKRTTESFRAKVNFPEICIWDRDIVKALPHKAWALVSWYQGTRRTSGVGTLPVST
eukprot:6811173-Prymnesium_polylepis.2